MIVLWAAGHWPPSLEALMPDDRAALVAHAGESTPPLVWLPVIALGVVLVAGAGARTVRWLGAEPCGPVETLGFSVAIGLGLAATAMTLAGLAGAFTRTGLTAATALVAALGWLGPGLGGGGAVLAALRALPRALRAPTCSTGAEAEAGEGVEEGPERTEVPNAALVAVALAALALGLVRACTPPWYPDALFYHLALPRLYLDAGAFVAVPQEPINAGHPGLAQMLYALPMSWGRDDLCAVLSWVCVAVGVGGAGILAQGLAGRAAGALAMAAVATVPHLVVSGATPLADGPLFAFVTLGVHATVRALRGADRGWARVASLCAGFALATKYQGALPLGLIALALFAGFTRLFGVKRMLALAVPCALLAAAPFAPWGVRNQLLYRCPLNPVVPRESTPAPVRDLLALFRADWVTHGHRASVAALPFDVTFFASPDQLSGYEGEAGPLPLLLAPLALLALARRSRAAAGLLVFVGVQGAAWVLGARELRYLLPLAPAFCAAALVPIARPAAPPFIGPAVLIGAIAALGWTAGYTRPGLDAAYLFGAESKSAYYATRTATRGLWNACRALDREPPGTRALFFWEDRGYLCRVPYLADHLLPTSSNHVLHALPADPEKLAARLAELRVTHLVINMEAASESARAGEGWTFSGPLGRFLAAGRAKALPGLGPESGAPVQVWRLQEPLSAPR